MFRLENAIRRQLRYRYIPTWLNGVIDRSLQVRRAFQRYPLADRVDSLSCRPLFIVSAGRSGTTLLRSMLVAGGQIAIPPETWVIPVAVRRFLSLRHLGWADMGRLVISLFESTAHFHLWQTNLHPVYQAVLTMPEPERSLARIIDEVFKCYADQQFPEALLWGDQSPGNTLHLPRVYCTFPRARYLHLVRDGRDAIASMAEKGDGLEMSVRRWKTSVKQAETLRSRLDHQQYLEIRYETLVRESAKTLDKICRFLGIEYQSSMLEFWRMPTTLEHQMYEHHRNLAKPIFTDSIGRWTERLSLEEQQYVTSHIADWLQSLGYST
jgi:hypothetical protein